MKLSRLNHVAVAVRDIDKHLEIFSGKLGLKHSEIIEVPAQGVKVAFVEFENSKIELIAPLNEQANLNKFLEKKGEGLHHIAVSVDNVNEAISELQGKEIQSIDKQGRPGAEGHPVAFLHPKSTGGVLIELEEE